MKKVLEKISKRKVMYTFIVLSLFLVCGLVIKAASEYYDYRWTNEVKDVWDNDVFITNDMIETSDGGFVAIGFDNSDEDGTPSVRFLNENGLLKKEVTLDDIARGQMKYVVEVDDGYLVFGAAPYEMVILKISKDYKVDDVKWLETDVNFNYTTEMYLVENGEYYYFFSNEYASVSPDFSGTPEVVRIKKDLSNAEEIFEEDYDATIKSIIAPYTRVWDYYNYDSASDYYYPIFTSEYNGGYVYGFSYYSDTVGTLLVYYKDGEEVWAKKYEDVYFKDAIDVNGNLLLASLEYDDDKDRSYSYLVLLDENAKELYKDDMSTYISEGADIFVHEHLILVGENGFALTGSSYYSEEDGVSDGSASLGMFTEINKPDEKPESDGKPSDAGAPNSGEQKTNAAGIPLLPDGSEPPKGASPDDKGGDSVNDAGAAPAEPNDAQAGGEYEDDYNMAAEVLYFNIIHNVYVKTDGNGTVVATKNEAGYGEEVTFTITPNEGYVLGVVKVTDANGNVVTFTDYTFTMPNADVTIEVTFYVENPETYAFIGIVVLALFGGSIALYLRNKNKKNYIES